jgi:hypothetical protein
VVFDGIVIGSELGGYVDSGYHKAQIIATGTQTPLMIQGGSGAVEVWADSGPSAANSFGCAVPGYSGTNDFIFSRYNNFWEETLRIINDTGQAQFQGNVTAPSQTITAPANTSALTASYSVTGSNTTPLLNLTGTWNTTGIARGILLNVTNTASNSASRLIDLQIGGTSRFWVMPSGGINSSSGINLGGNATISSGNLQLNQSSLISWDSATTLQRDGASAVIAQRAGANAQTFRLYATYTDSSNGRRLDITSTTAGIFTLTATGNGTGASGNLLKLTAPILLPASSVSLATNGDLAFEATSNTSLTIRYRGSDGTTRSAAITLS